MTRDGESVKGAMEGTHGAHEESPGAPREPGSTAGAREHRGSLGAWEPGSL